MISGQTVTVPLDLADRYRPYVVTVTLVGETDSGAA